jgi:hypothetical protein
MRFFHTPMLSRGIGVSSHQYFSSLCLKNIVWLLPGLGNAASKHASASRLRLSIPREVYKNIIAKCPTFCLLFL